jgi:hypothetical protein
LITNLPPNIRENPNAVTDGHHICYGCRQRLRQLAFNSGFQKEELEDGIVLYTPAEEEDSDGN